MADFTITTTITGNVNGKALSIEHTYTVEDVTHVIEDAALVAAGKPVSTFQNLTEGRGYHVQLAPKFMAFGLQQAANGTMFIGTSGVNVPEMTIIGNSPMSIHHGEDFDGNIDYAPASTTPPDPAADIETVQITGRAPFEIRGIALLKPVS